MSDPDLRHVILSRGVHPHRTAGLCATEAVAWLAGEPHTDYPTSLSPVIGSYLRTLNDSLSKRELQKVVPMLPKLVGTRGGRSLERKRALLCVNVSLRHLLPGELDRLFEAILIDMRPVLSALLQEEVGARLDLERPGVSFDQRLNRAIRASGPLKRLPGLRDPLPSSPPQLARLHLLKDRLEEVLEYVDQREIESILRQLVRARGSNISRRKENAFYAARLGLETSIGTIEIAENMIEFLRTGDRLDTLRRVPSWTAVIASKDTEGAIRLLKRLVTCSS